MKSLPFPIPIRRTTGRILDIGSGNNCLDIATHIVDLMPTVDAERAGPIEVPEGKEFKEGSVEAVPFPDKFFDFAHASHVLEHTYQPEKALAEIQRVASAGYIETPAGVMEQGCFYEPEYPGWRFHRWFVWTFPNQQRLYLKPKADTNLRDYCDCEHGQAFAEILRHADFRKVDPLLPYYCKMTQFAWNEKIDFEIWGENQQGKLDAEGRCNCMYAAFFAQTGVYFRSWRQLKRRFQFRWEVPEAYRIVSQVLSTR